MKNAKELNNSFCGASIYGGEVTLRVQKRHLIA